MSLQFPLDLEREIFEFAFKLNPTDAALRLNLSLVARRVQFWIDILFYDMVTISDKLHADHFLRLVDSKSPGFFAIAVRILCIPYSVTAAQAHSILSACTGVRLLACWVDYGHSLEPVALPRTVSQLPLRRLSIEFEHFLKIPAAPSTWLAALTHVDLVFWGEIDPARLAPLGRLPKLTHVALTSTLAGVAHARLVCDVCPLLQVLIIVHEPHDSDSDGVGYEFDPRIVEISQVHDVISDWQSFFYGQPDMWSHAEDIIKKRSSIVRVCEVTKPAEA
ncbi:hypothetical protein B0H10DRAFT_1950567 [Mycena sp. CBHHK59/15]|nr:hypothetical protein B0H10DRAFT_1950567 [Mycena sp. CBHHK59/15]